MLCAVTTCWNYCGCRTSITILFLFKSTYRLCSGLFFPLQTPSSMWCVCVIFSVWIDLKLLLLCVACNFFLFAWGIGFPRDTFSTFVIIIVNLGGVTPPRHNKLTRHCFSFLLWSLQPWHACKLLPYSLATCEVAIPPELKKGEEEACECKDSSINSNLEGATGASLIFTPSPGIAPPRWCHPSFLSRITGMVLSHWHAICCKQHRMFKIASMCPFFKYACSSLTNITSLMEVFMLVFDNVATHADFPRDG